MTDSQPESAFTVTEVLVVIAVIALLALLLFPAFARAGAKARQTTCTNNLRQLGAATLQYIQDYDEHIYPYEYNGPTGPGDRYTWEYYTDYLSDHPNDYRRGILYPYVNNVQVFQCPDAASFAGISGGNSGSYGFNRIYLTTSVELGGKVSGTSDAGSPVAAVEAPAETLLIGDAAEARNAPLHGWDQLTPPSSAGGDLHGLHLRFANVVWLDGHTKSVKPVCAPRFNLPCQIDTYDLGVYLHGSFTGRREVDDYYYELVKNP